MTRRSIAVAALAVSLGLAACGGDDANVDEPAAQAPPAGDVERYCALTKQLDAAGEEVFSALDEEEATPEAFEAAERRFVEQNAGTLEELRQVAPGRIRADVDKLIAGIRRRAGLEPAGAASEQEASAAEERVRAFERRACA